MSVATDQLQAPLVANGETQAFKWQALMTKRRAQGASLARYYRIDGLSGANLARWLGDLLRRNGKLEKDGRFDIGTPPASACNQVVGRWAVRTTNNLTG